MFLYQDSILHTKIFRVIELTVARLQLQFFFKNDILKNVKKMEKIDMDFEKSINSFEMQKKDVTWLFIEQNKCF